MRMENTAKFSRSKSLREPQSKLLQTPSRVERSVSDGEAETKNKYKEDSDVPAVLPILRIAGRIETKQQRRQRVSAEKQQSAEAGGGSGGQICYSDLLHLLGCGGCGGLVSGEVAQCRRGHLTCAACRLPQCRLCGQAVPEPQNQHNIALQRILSLIALPCKYGWVSR